MILTVIEALRHDHLTNELRIGIINGHGKALVSWYTVQKDALKRLSEDDVKKFFAFVWI